MRSDQTIWLSAPHASGLEKKFIDEAFELGHIFPLGPNVTGLENDICEYTGAMGCTCLASGTAAIHLALLLLGVKSGDEIICSTFTFSATVNPILYQQAVPVFVDSEYDTWNMDPDLLQRTIERRIRETGEKPKAIIVVHLYGMPANLKEIMRIADHYQIPVIEDAAEALGSTFENQYVGTFGELGIYSFNGNKIITTSGGGALISGDPEYNKKALYLATQARDSAPHYQHSAVGYNYRMSNICAGIGRGQMLVLQERINKRRENFFYYRDRLSDIQEIKFLEEPTQDYFSNHWLTTLLIDRESKKDREELRNYLEQYNIETRPLWKPMHLQPVFSRYPTCTPGVAEDLFNRGLCLPSSSNLSEDDRHQVVSCIRKYFDQPDGSSM